MNTALLYLQSHLDVELVCDVKNHWRTPWGGHVIYEQLWSYNKIQVSCESESAQNE